MQWDWVQLGGRENLSRKLYGWGKSLGSFPLNNNIVWAPKKCCGFICVCDCNTRVFTSRLIKKDKNTKAAGFILLVPHLSLILCQLILSTCWWNIHSFAAFYPKCVFEIFNTEQPHCPLLNKRVNWWLNPQHWILLLRNWNYPTIKKGISGLLEEKAHRCLMI